MGLLDKLKIKKDEEKSTDEISADVKIEEKKEEVEKKTITKKKTTPKKGAMGKILIRPLISEKAAIAETAGMYTFVVAQSASKIDIKNAIKEVYGVEPKRVHVMNMEGKAKRYGRSRGRRSDWKKAIITLSKGQSISIHEGV
ncbi:MAG: 50S ribosomal protein L23 [Candidatus Magasanikbacteria bacterium]